MYNMQYLIIFNFLYFEPLPPLKLDELFSISYLFSILLNDSF